MPKVRFTNEATEVECARGANLLEVCQKAGVNVFRGIWQEVHCRSSLLGRLMPLGACGRCKLWVKPAVPSAVNPPTRKEAMHPKVAGTLRLACQVEVQGDLEVTTKPGWQPAAENTEWRRDPTADSSKWMERWRKAKAGGAKDEAEEEPSS